MNTAPSIASEILAHFESGKSLTALQCLKLFGTMRLSARVTELKKDGHNIVKTTKTKNGKAFAEYSFIP